MSLVELPERQKAREPIYPKAYLRDCPFCGRAPTIRPASPQGSVKIECVATGCKAAAYVIGDDAQDAVARWNRRR